RLELERKFPHLVQEERAAVGELEAADLLSDGVGEGSSLVAEELALEEGRWDGGTVDLDEGSLAAPAPVVDRACDQLLPRPGLTEDEHRRVGRRDGVDLPQDVPERATLAHEVREGVLAGALPLDANHVVHRSQRFPSAVTCDLAIVHCPLLPRDALHRTRPHDLEPAATVAPAVGGHLLTRSAIRVGRTRKIDRQGSENRTLRRA